MFNWDDANRGHIRMHGVEPNEAEEAAEDPFQVYAGSQIVHAERRWTIIGRTAGGRILTVILTARGANIRVVTAFPARGRQMRTYRENNG